MNHYTANIRKGVTDRLQESFPYQLQEVFYWIWENLNERIIQNCSSSTYKIEQYQPICKDQRRYCGIYLPQQESDIIAYIDFQKRNKIICIGVYEEHLQKDNTNSLKIHSFPDWGSKFRALKGLHVMRKEMGIINILEGCYKSCMEEKYPNLMRYYKNNK